MTILWCEGKVTHSGREPSQIINVAAGGGITASQIDGDGYSGYNQPGILLFISPFLKKNRFLFSIYMCIIQKGSRKTANFFSMDFYGFSIRLNYLSISLRVMYSPGRIGYFGAGISAGYLFFSSEKDLTGPVRILGPFHKWEIAVNAGYRHYFSNRIFGELLLEYSLFPITNTYKGGNILWPYKGSFNNTLILSVGYLLSSGN